MRTDELRGTALDYGCARALCSDDADTLRFTAIAPKVIVTAACDALRRRGRFATFVRTPDRARHGRALRPRNADSRKRPRSGDRSDIRSIPRM